MKKQTTQNKMGFSLIELSIVILVIGILVLGITKGSAILAKAKIGSARSLTAGSPVALTDDLIAWYETTLETSFNEGDAVDGKLLNNATGANWFDNSPAKDNDATTTTGTTRPTYVESSTNSLPAVRFVAGAVDASIAFNASPLNQKYYTVFIVERRAAQNGVILSLGGDNTAANSPTTIEYSADTTLGNTGTGSTPVNAFGNSLSRISTFLSDSTGQKVAVNGVVDTTNDTKILDTKLTTTANGFIGNSEVAGNTAYVGDISEIIIFNRGLKVSERNDIQNYLGKKYSINVKDSLI